MTRKYFFALVLMVVALITATIVAYIQGAHLSVLNPAGPIAKSERNIIELTLVLCTTIVAPLFFLLFYFLWTFRVGNPQAHKLHLQNWDHFNRFSEFAWWLVPSMIIFLLSFVMWQSAHSLDPYKPLASEDQTLTVQVVALDWKWLFIYPQYHIASVNLLEFPAHTPVRFLLTADAPMNSFWIPMLGGQIMVMPGMTTQLNLLADRTGDFNGVSANISGEGFASMSFTARAVSADDFHTWVEHIQNDASSTPLTKEAYTLLAKPGTYSTTTLYAPVADSLFSEIPALFMSPEMQMAASSTMTR